MFIQVKKTFNRNTVLPWGPVRQPLHTRWQRRTHTHMSTPAYTQVIGQSLQRCHIEHSGVPNHQRLLRRKSYQENIKAPRHWPLWGEFTGDRWTPCTKGQVTRKMFPFDDVIMIIFNPILLEKWIFLLHYKLNTNYTIILIYSHYKMSSAMCNLTQKDVMWFAKWTNIPSYQPGDWLLHGQIKHWVLLIDDDRDGSRSNTVHYNRILYEVLQWQG